MTESEDKKFSFYLINQTKFNTIRNISITLIKKKYEFKVVGIVKRIETKFITL